MEARGEATGTERAQVRVVSYLNNYFFVQHSPKDVDLLIVREMRTWAESIDLLLEGDMARLGDMMMQRLKALAHSVADSSWATARHHELIPQLDGHFANEDELEAVAQAEHRAAKLRKALEEAKSRGARMPG